MLRALDGWREHASYRDLAAILLNADAQRQSRRDWLTSPSRAQIIRIVRDGIFRVEGGYSQFLEKKEEFLLAQSNKQEALANRVQRCSGSSASHESNSAVGR